MKRFSKERVKEIRKELNFPTQAAFAKEFGLSKGVVSMWESGQQEIKSTAWALFTHSKNTL